MAENDEQSVYAHLGGDAGVRALADRFYDIMDGLPEARPIRAMHPADLTESRQKLYEFLSGWLGGPQLYVQRRGHPRLRARHMPFPVDQAAADQWILCMDQALMAESVDPQLRFSLMMSFAKVANHMRNRAG
ncbi:MAG: group II truncated hemoglobin [Myxococcota bacterium]|nr:group II truncated hemoglobin [Myxococcota bacterium]MEC8422133.1 group II truncated hemoglobin [Myxococcota bacterium]